jgi:hypothetical protein
MTRTTLNRLLLVAALAAAGASLGCGGVSGSASDAGCLAGTERCACYANSTCNAGLVCASDRCVQTPGGGGTGGGSGGAGVSGAAGASGGSSAAGTTGAGGGQGGGTAGAAGGLGTAGGGAGAGGSAGSGGGATRGVAGGGGGSGNGGRTGAGGSGPAGAPGTGGHAGTSGAAGNGGSAGVGGSQAGGGSGGVGGAGGASCFQFLTTTSQITTATQGLTVMHADFGHDSSGTAFSVSQIVPGEDFATHASVTFESVDTSNQAAVGTTIDEVAEGVGSPAVIYSVSPAASSYAGFDGIKSNFAAPQTVVAVSGTIGQNVPQDSFTLVVFSASTTQTTMFTIPTTATFTGGVQSLCGAVITELDVLPNRNSDASNHLSTYWSMTDLTFAH